jgi:hypothetical protein
MSDRLFTLAQEITQIRQQCQQGLSETKSYDDSSHNNRLLALEQSLTVMQPHSQANAYGYGDMIDGRRHRATNRMGVTADDMFDSSGESGYTMPDNRRRGMPASDYIQDSRDDIQAARDEIQASRNTIQNARADRRIGASAGARMQNFRNDEAEFIRPMRGDRRRGTL